jgi:hypothetical protein
LASERENGHGWKNRRREKRQRKLHHRCVIVVVGRGIIWDRENTTGGRGYSFQSDFSAKGSLIKSV